MGGRSTPPLGQPHSFVINFTFNPIRQLPEVNTNNWVGEERAPLAGSAEHIVLPPLKGYEPTPLTLQLRS